MAQTIAVMTGGGDCPGLNAAIRTIVRTAIRQYGSRVVGIEDGFEGLIEGRVRELTVDSTRGIIRIGGTILGASNRADPARYIAPGAIEARDARADAMATLRSIGAKGLIVIGGDGTMRLTHDFANGEIPIVGIPKTIDNDVPGTDVSIGFNTCVTTVTDAVDRLHTTAESHHRIALLEVMGRTAGWVALSAGVAGGADFVLIPERAYNVEEIVAKIRRREANGRRFTIGVVAEGVPAPDGKPVYRATSDVTHQQKLGGVSLVLARELEREIRQDVNTIVLGHIQRGGSPSVFDRLLATRLAYAATEAIHAGTDGMMAAVQGDTVRMIPLQHVATGPKCIPADDQLLRAAEAMGLYVGTPR